MKKKIQSQYTDTRPACSLNQPQTILPPTRRCQAHGKAVTRVTDMTQPWFKPQPPTLKANALTIRPLRQCLLYNQYKCFLLKPSKPAKEFMRNDSQVGKHLQEHLCRNHPLAPVQFPHALTCNACARTHTHTHTHII